MSNRIEIREVGSEVVVTGPYHLMQGAVMKRLKSQGFRFDWGSKAWTILASKLSPLQRKNLEKIVEPAPGADLRSPAEKAQEEIARRKREGLALDVPFDMKDWVKGLGGLFDPATRWWALPDPETYAKVQERVGQDPSVLAKRELARRKSEGLIVQAPYEYKDWIKGLGGLFDGGTKSWYMPDRDAVNTVHQKVRDDLKEEETRKRQEAEEAARRKRERELAEGLRTLYIPGRTKGDAPRVGAVFRDRKSREVVEVLSVKSTYYPEDGMSFGLMDDRGWMHAVVVRPASPEERERVDARDREEESRAEARRRVRDERKALVKLFQDAGDRPERATLHGDRIALEGRDSLIYGGGSWFVVEGSHIWYVMNNGHDGDDWSYNNVQTGGAGAIGWRLPRTDALEARVRAVDEGMKAGG